MKVFLRIHLGTIQCPITKDKDKSNVSTYCKDKPSWQL